MPRLVEVRTEAEALGVAHQPAISRSVDLNRAIRVFRVHRIAANVEIQRATGEVWTVNCESRGAGIRRLAAQLVLIIRRTIGGDDLEVTLFRRELVG